jgi:serine/threonine-protein kinase
MPDDLEDLSLSRTFRMVDGHLALEDTFEKILQVSSAGLGSKHSLGLTGTVIDSKYKVLSFLGEGGMGTVYLVLHLLLNKEMALKTFRTANLSPDAWRRFQREAQSIGKLTHANIVQVFDFGIGEQNFPYYTMEFLVGESLAGRLERMGRLRTHEALPIFIAVAGGMAHAHRQGIVHRDIKPANIFMEQSKGLGTPRIVDFGLAKLAESQSLDSQSVTAEGLVFGSPLYMSPEQSHGLDTDQRTDIYSFGCSLFHALTGVPPFVGQNALTTVLMHQQEVPPRLVQAAGGRTFPERLEVIVAKLLAKDAKRRYQSFDEVERELSLLSLSGVKASVSAPGDGQKSKPRAETEADAEAEADAETEAEASPWDEQGTLKKAMSAIGGFLLLVVIAVTLIGGIGAFVYDRRGQEDPPQLFSRKTVRGTTIFTFPQEKESVGEWSLDGIAFQPVVGPVMVPAGRSLFFRAGKAFADHPDFFRGFQPDDLISLTLPRRFEWNGKHLAEIGRLRMLHHLNVAGIHLNVSDVQYICMLSGLVHLNVSETRLTGKDLAQLSRLRHLQNLEANSLADMGPLLDKLQNSTSLTNLSLKECDLTDDDLRKIAAIRSVNVLIIDSNAFSAKGIKQLATLPDLVILQMGSLGVGPEIIDVLPKLKRLSTVRIKTEYWASADIERLKKALPKGCNLEQ